MDRGATPKTIWRLLSGAVFAVVIAVGLIIPVLAASGAFSGPADPRPLDKPTSGASLEAGAAVAASSSPEGSITALVTVASSVDSDADGVPDSPDNCPLVPNGLNEAAIPGVGNQTNTDAALSAEGVKMFAPNALPSDALGDACDSDDDNDSVTTVTGVTFWTDTVEASIGTDPLEACPRSSTHDAWPPDFDKSRKVDISDVLKLKPVFLTNVPPASSRFDLDPSGKVDISDVLRLKPYFLKSCTVP